LSVLVARRRLSWSLEGFVHRHSRLDTGNNFFTGSSALPLTVTITLSSFTLVGEENDIAVMKNVAGGKDYPLQWATFSLSGSGR
jgi:hypothetical protein